MSTLLTDLSFNDLEKDKEKIEYIKHRLMYSDPWLLRALIVLYNNQTEDEKYKKDTKYKNGIGFNATDALILTNLAEQYIEKNWLSEKQIKICRRLIPKYSKQLNELAKERGKEK